VAVHRRGYVLLTEDEFTRVAVPWIGAASALGGAADHCARCLVGAILRATSTNALNAGDTWDRLGKYRKNPGTAAAYGSSTFARRRCHR
jgi:hypothetical protein